MSWIALPKTHPLFLLSLLSFFFTLAFMPAGYAADDRNDHLAEILRVTGSAKILKQQTGSWQEAAKGIQVQAGDQITTQAGGIVEIAYDAKRLNIGRINSNTQAEFVSIEPTEIRLTDGSLFNALDDLPKRQTYQIVTQTAVAAVRGTHFNVNYNSQNRQMNVGVFNDRTPGLSNVTITSQGQGQNSFEIGEGNQAGFDPQSLQAGPVETSAVSQDQENSANEAMNSVAELREEGGGTTGGTNNGSPSGDPTQEMTQGEFALWLVKEAGAIRQISPAGDAQDAIDFLMKLGIVPEGGWQKDAKVTDEFLRSFLGEDGAGLSREEILQRIQDLIDSRFEDSNVSQLAAASSASGSSS